MGPSGDSPRVSGIVTLSEAESLRAAIHAAHPVASSSALQLLRLDDFRCPTSDATLAARLFNGDLWYSPHDAGVLLRQLASVPTSMRQEYFTACLRRRIRTISNWQGTSVEQVGLYGCCV